MRVRLAAIALLASLCAACGSASGGGSGSGDSAGLVPADALGYLTVDTDLGSGQVSSAQKVLAKFPIETKLLAQIRSSIAKDGIDVQGLKSSVGPEVDVAVLKVNGQTGAVGFTHPKDEKAFDAQLDKGTTPTLHTSIDGWTVFSDKQAFLDAVKNRSAQLADDAAYQAAMKTIPASGDAILRAYVSPAGAQTATGAASGRLGSAAGSLGSLTASAKWAAVALTSQDGAFKLEIHSKTDATKATTGSGLADEIPSGSIVALSLTGGTGTFPAQLQQQLSTMSTQLGVNVSALVSALQGPVIAYVKPGLPLPDITIAARPADPAAASQAVGQLIAKVVHGASAAVPTKVEGGTLNKVDLGSLALFYGVADGKVVVTDSANALAELNGANGHLTGDSVFKDAKDAASMPDASQGFLFVDLKDALPAVDGFAQLANKTIPPEIDANLKPLRSLLVYGSRDSGIQTVVVHLATS